MNFRQIHLDFHTSEKIAGIGSNFSKEQFQAALKLGHVNSITIFSKCHHGWAYHPSKANEQHPGLDFDLLGAEIEAAQIVASGQTAAAEIKAKTETEVARIYAEAQAANLELFQFLKNLDTTIASVKANDVYVVDADQYPFNVLTEYGDFLTGESDETIIKDLDYILARLPEKDRAALIEGIYALMAQAEKTGGAS